MAAPKIEETILSLLAARADGASICPSDAAKEAFGDEWRAGMEATREAARRLVERGVVEITQRGRVVDPMKARGPIRIRLRR